MLKRHLCQNYHRMWFTLFIIILYSSTQIYGFVLYPQRFDAKLNPPRSDTPSSEIEIYSVTSEMSPPIPVPPPPPLPPYYIVNKLDPELKKMYESLKKQSLEIYDNISNKTWKKFVSKYDNDVYVRVQRKRFHFPYTALQTLSNAILQYCNTFFEYCQSIAILFKN